MRKLNVIPVWLLALALCAALAGLAAAQAKYPTKTVEIVVPYGAGGGTDNVMRMIVGHVLHLDLGRLLQGIGEDVVNSGGEVTTALMGGHVDAAVEWSRS